MKEFIEAWKRVDRDRVALLLSIVPGAGHLYKHHYGAGLGILLGGNLLMAFIAILLAMATAGFALAIVPIIWWAAIGISAYGAEDRHGKHHFLHPWSRKAATDLPPQ